MHMTADGHRRDMVRLIKENATRADLWSVWSDFIEMSALAIANAVDWAQRTEREARYMAIVKRYSKEQAMRFAHALGALTMAMEKAEFGDILGTTFMELDLGSKWAGQFFTPYEVCRVMAGITLGNGVDAKLQERGFITACDPAVGAGALPIALAEELHRAGHNYQKCLHVTAQDVDQKAAHMAYIQLSLLHVPAVVIVGNTLANECRERWFTPAHILGGWSRKLATRDVEQAPAVVPHLVPVVEDARPAKRSKAQAMPKVEPAGQPMLEGLFD